MAAPSPLVSPARAQLQTKRRELGRVQKELEQTRQEIEEFQRLEKSLSRDLKKIETENTESRRRLSRIKVSIEAARRRKTDLGERLVSLGQASGFWKASWRSELGAYEARLMTRPESTGTDGLWAEALARAAIVDKGQVLRGLQGLGRRTAQAEAESRRKADELAVRGRKAAAEQEDREAQAREKKSAIAEAQERRAAAVKHAQELEESAKALTKLVRELAKPRKHARPGSKTPWLAVRGTLPWPASGEVVTPFGRARNPELDTWVIHQGLLLRTPPGAAVTAVADGTVIFSGPFRSYGEVVIVDHGSNFFSIYGELGSRLKEKDARVRAGEALARAGGAPADGRGTVYLEFRRGTEAVDPLPWLKKR